jgi:hypothetical protein
LIFSEKVSSAVKYFTLCSKDMVSTEFRGTVSRASTYVSPFMHEPSEAAGAVPCAVNKYFNCVLRLGEKT